MTSEIEYRTGDLFDQPDVDAVGHGVNVRGVMGAGIARVFRAKHPGMYAEYVTACTNGDLAVGGVLPWLAPGDGQWVYNIASQQEPGTDARLDALAQGVDAALAHASAAGVRRLALPRIGCGIGGLAWEDVITVLEATARRWPAVRLIVVTHPSDV